MNPTSFRSIAIRSAFNSAVVACLAVALATTFFCEASSAQSSSKKKVTSDNGQSKLQSYLEQKDANGNGSIEPDEMSENTKNSLSKMGLNTEKSIKIPKAIKASGKKTGQANSADKPTLKKREQTNLKVPGFGVEKQSGSVRSFSSSAGAASKTTKTYSENVVQQTERTLERYDRNQDGVLDESEISRARWGSPRPSNSDLNGDGRLSKNELNERYSAREKFSSGDSRRDRYDRYSRSSSSDRDSARDTDRDKARNSERDSDSDRSQYSKHSASYSGSSRSKSDDRAKYQKYAQSLMKSYDKDKDGKLDKTELKKMKRPHAGADTNNDGFVSENELAEHFKTSSNVAPKQPSSRSSRTPSRKKPSSSSRSRTSTSMKKLDANGDNQVQMHEFSDEWDEEVVAEYYEADKNRDGVITAAEWSDR